MDFNSHDVLSLIGALAAAYAAVTSSSTKMAILEIKLWVTQNFEPKKKGDEN